jgi:hypothetical protein
VAEVLYVVDGDFISESKQNLPGTLLHVKSGGLHGPHTTERAARFALPWTAHSATQEANLVDFNVAKAAAANW